MKHLSKIIVAVVPALTVAGTLPAQVFADSIPEFISEIKVYEGNYDNAEKEGFDNAGVTELICDATENYSFTASDKNTSWKVYVLDEKFEDAARFLPQANKPALEGNGTLKIAEGQYIYILCGDSSFTADAPSGATYTINYAG